VLTNAPVKAVEIRLQPLAGNVYGRVTHGLTGTPVAGANVTVEGRRVRTDTDGRYHLVSLSPGAYTVEVRLDGYRTDERSITLQPGETQPLDLALTPAGTTLWARVVDAATGRPIKSASISYVSTGSSSADDLAGCADYALLVPLKRSRKYGLLRPRIADLRPADAWQQDGLHFFVFELRPKRLPHRRVREIPVVGSPKPPGGLCHAPDPGTPISAVEVTPRPDDDQIVLVEAPTATQSRNARVATARMTRRSSDGSPPRAP
jgi:hypothetical protein